MDLSLNGLIQGALASNREPIGLTEVYEKLKTLGISKPTLHRHLQKMVDDGLISREGEKYVLLASKSSTSLAEDVVRISTLKPARSKTQKGYRVTAYGNDRLENVDWEPVLKALEPVRDSILRQVDPTLEGASDPARLRKESLAKLVGTKFAVVLSFDGTQFAALSSTEVVEKRREAMRLVAEKKGITRDELMKALGLNALEIGQILQPLVSSGYASIDDEGRITYTLEVGR